MERHGPADYGDSVAHVYDQLYGDVVDTDATVEFLWQLIRGGKALELGIGTGRVALPLKEMGIEVHGIDASPAMVERLRAKPGGADIPVTIGDFADFELKDRFDLVFVVFNTFFHLLSQEDQIRCFARMAEHLDDDGLVVIEVFVPDLTRFTRHQYVGLEQLTADGAILDASVHDPVRQRWDSERLSIGEGGVEIYPIESRYAWPSELDLMARLAGLRLRDRWGGWRREPFTSDSKLHVSIYERNDVTPR